MRTRSVFCVMYSKFFSFNQSSTEFKSCISKPNVNKNALGSVLSQLNALSEDIIGKVRIKELSKPPKDLQAPDLDFMYFSNRTEAGEKLQA